MKIKTFYRQSRCEKIAGFEKLIYEDGRRSVMTKATDMVCSLLAAGSTKESILSQIQDFLKSSYEKNDTNFPWERNQYLQDTMLYQRMLNFLEENFTKFVKAHVETHIDTNYKLQDGSFFLEGKVNLVVLDEKGRYHGLIIHNGTCSRSINGKSVHTTAATDLHCMIAKYCLEDSYPNIVIHPLYLSHKTDTPKTLRNTLEISDYATSNFHSLAYADYYCSDSGVFNYELLKKLIDSVVISKSENACFNCSWMHLCKTPLLADNSKESQKSISEESTYQIPSYTEEQLQVVRHVTGPMLVCAGPGSGKTATIIGRIRYLVEECKIHPRFILVVTFTNEAAQELRRRCLSFLEEGNLPKIATLNAFCYGVLLENQDLMGKKLKLLGKKEKAEIVKNLLSYMPPPAGIHCKEESDLDNYYLTICHRLDDFSNYGEHLFFQKHPGIGHNFVYLAEKYKEIIESQDYITFDEQISLCNKLFAEHPDVLKIYSSIYQYVMVDEYQDVNEEQVQMLYSLASHQNLVVVGDDDQSIYGFRGASAEFMIRFPKHFKTAKSVVLKFNFRSTKTLVNAAQHLIKNNQQRIAKNIESGNDVEGVLPEVISSMDAADIDVLIEKLLSAGYSYEDIAILSTKNAPLEELHSSLQAPTVLAKSYLREDGLFIFAHTILQLFENMGNDRAFLQYMTLFGKADLLRRRSNMSLYEATCSEYNLKDFRMEPEGIKGSCFEKELAILDDMFTLLSTKPSISIFLQICKYKIQWEFSDSVSVMMDLLNKQGITTLPELLSFMNYVVNYQDETRVEVDTAGKVTLITCHDAKGKEFPVVLIRNDYSSFSEEVRRVFYVAITRAKERLFVLQDKNCKVDFLKEFPHTMEVTGEKKS